jgi:hypothetical protein
VSEYAALREASRALSGLLRERFLADAQLDPLFGAGHVISLKSPREMRGGQPPEVGLSIWLYAIDRNEFLLNRPPERVATDRLRSPPIPVNLHYLLTPITDDVESEQLILGKVLQVLHDDPVIAVDPTRPELRDELRISFEPLDLESVTRIWNALDESYQLCASYLVQVVRVDSAEEPTLTTPVLEKLSQHNQIVGVS